MARRSTRAAPPAAPPGDYVTINNRGSFQLNQDGGNAQYRDGIDSVQSTLEYRGECTWKGVRCSVFREVEPEPTKSEVKPTKPAGSEDKRKPKYGWLFSALQDVGGQQHSKVGFVALEDITALEEADVLPFGDAIYTRASSPTNLRTLRKLLKEESKKKSDENIT